MKNEDISFIRQMIISMKNLTPKIEEAYRNQDTKKFNDYKKMFLKFGEEIQNKINGI